MTLSSADIEYFQRGGWENALFWSRLGGMPDLKGLRAVDVGCGHGSLCVNMALNGVEKAIGVDLDDNRIAFAKMNAAQSYPKLANIVDFRCCGIEDVPERDFDLVVSKDSFEHIIGLDKTISEMKARLKRGGRLYAGFSPLYNSPFGDHRRTGLRCPWAHAFVPERRIIRRLHRQGRTDVNSIQDLGLNALSLAQYKTILRESGMEIAYLRVNVSKNPLLWLFTCLARIPFLTEYFSHNLYCILVKRD
jgi:SAM-dependent methyltransferase